MEFEKYITLLNNRHRIILCKFRCGNFKIPSITGRFDNVEFHERICKLCFRRSIGDEFHYLFECDAFTTKRNLYIKNYFIRNPSTFKMEQLLQTKSKKKLMKLSLFCNNLRNAFNCLGWGQEPTISIFVLFFSFLPTYIY